MNSMTKKIHPTNYCKTSNKNKKSEEKKEHKISCFSPAKVNNCLNCWIVINIIIILIKYHSRKRAKHVLIISTKYRVPLWFVFIPLWLIIVPPWNEYKPKNP